MRRHLFILAAFAILSGTGAFAQETCSAGYKKLNAGEPCIPERLFNYLYCLKSSGGGKVEIIRKTDSSGSKGLEISVGGKGSGVVISAEGNIAVKKSDATRVAQEVSEKIDPTLSANCKSMVQYTGKSSTTPTTPPASVGSGSVQNTGKSSTTPTTPPASVRRESGSEQSIRLSKLLPIIGFPSSAEIRWGHSLDDFDRIVPVSDRAISRTDMVSVKGRASINSLPADVRFIFENRRLAAIALVSDSWYSKIEHGNSYTAKTTLSKTEGDEVTGKKMCTSTFIREVERRMDAMFSKVKDISSNHVVHTDFTPSSFGCQQYGCKSESYSDIWKLGYKDPEASTIDVQHTVRRNYYSYEGKQYNVGEETAYACSTEIIFRSRSVGGI